MFENRVLSKLFGAKKEKVTGNNLIVRVFMLCTALQILVGRSDKGG